VVPLPAVLTLQNTWVHIHILNGSNETANVEMVVDNVLCQRTALGILDVDPNHSHIRFGRSLDNLRL